MNLKKYPTSFHMLVLIFILLPIIPKEYSTILKVLPTRMFLIFLLFIFYLNDLFRKKITINDFNYKKYLLFSLMFVFGIGLSIVKTSNIVISIYTILKFVSYFALAFVALSMKLTIDQRKIIAKTIFSTAAIITIYGIVQYIFRIDLNIAGIEKYPGAIGRVSATFFNTIYYGVYLNLIILLFSFAVMKGKSKKTWLIYFILILAIINLIFTYTRSAYLLYFINMFFFAFINIKNIKKLMKKLAPILLISILLFTYLPGSKEALFSGLNVFIPNNLHIKTDKTTNKVSSESKNINKPSSVLSSASEVSSEISSSSSKDKLPPNNEKDFSINHRKDFGIIAKKVIKDNKALGIGIGNYEGFFNEKDNYDKYVEKKFGFPHNFYLHISAETGYIGLISVMIIMSIIIYNIIKHFIFMKEKRYNLLFISIIFLDILLVCLYESLLYDSQITPIIILVVALFFTCKREDSEKKEKDMIMFISSVGGHLTQLLQLKNIFSKNKYVLITEKTDLTRSMKNDLDIEYLKYGSRQYIFKYIFVFIINTFKSFYLYLKYSPKVVVTTGAHTAVPMCYIAKFWGSKIIFIESFAKRTTPTLSGRLVYPIANTFVIQWKSLKKHYPRAVYWGRIY